MAAASAFRTGYPAYRNILQALGIEAVEIPTGPETGYCLSAAAIRTAHAETPLDAVLIMSPANPTGVLTRQARSPRSPRPAVISGSGWFRTRSITA